MPDAMDTLPKTANIIGLGMDRGLHHGAQLYVSFRGRPVVDAAFGVADAESNAPMTTDHLTLWMSASKPLGAVAVARLWEQGKLDLDARVADTITGFGLRGKHEITLRDILMHTGGFRESNLAFVEPDWDTAVAKVCAAPLEDDWKVGQTAGYDPRGSWYILGEMVRRADGRSYANYVREEICAPLGMRDSWVGMPAQAYHDYADRIAPTYEREQSDLVKNALHHEDACVACFPAGNGRGPIRELGRFYEMLVNRGVGEKGRLLNAETVTEFTRPLRVGVFDKTFNHTMDWALGFMVDSNQYGAQTVPYGFGIHCSPETFGHGGRQSVAAFADPVHELVVACVFNGMPGEPRHNKRNRELATAVYEDLGLGP